MCGDGEGARPAALDPGPALRQQAHAGEEDDKTPTALQKHRAWLAEFKKRQEEIREQAAAEEQAKAERKAQVGPQGRLPSVAVMLVRLL